MHSRTLYCRSLAYYWRAHFAAGLGVIAGTAALVGALLVGDSMRGSLRETALDRLGRVEYTLVTPRFFHAGLADELSAAGLEVLPVIIRRGGCMQAESRAFVGRVNVVGVDRRFWGLDNDRENGRFCGEFPESGRAVVLNEALAVDLRAKPGDEVLLRLGRPDAISTETLLGRRDNTTLTLRLTVTDVIAAEGLGAFSLDLRQAVARNAYVPLETLQRATGQVDRANALLVGISPENGDELDRALHESLTLADLGLRLRVNHELNYVALESEAFLLEPAVEQAARAAVDSEGKQSVAILSYLANSISVTSRPEKRIPYSTVAAVETADEVLAELLSESVSWQVTTLAPGQILLNEWAAQDLQASVGERIRLSYFVTDSAGGLQTEQAEFELAGIVSLQDSAADPGFVPEYPGITDSDRLSDWDPPFPLDLRAVRERDEEYWERYGATPKAFIALSDGQRIWTESSARYGRLTSLRLYPSAGASLEELRDAFERAFLKQLDPARVGMRFDAARERALIASTGSTDFGGLFVGFSFFLIISAALLVALLFRLGVERRAGEVGLLLAVGFSPRRISRLLLIEGLLPGGLAALVGLVVARGYAWLMLFGLRHWWSGAVNMPFLRLHDSMASYAIGYFAGLLIAVAAMAWSLRGLARLPVHGLLAGVIQSGRVQSPGPRRTITLVTFLAAVVLAGLFSTLTLFSDALSQSLSFFLGGAALLVAWLTGMAYWLGCEPRASVRQGGWWALLRLGMRNARRRIGRSILTTGLIASATFVIVALQALRLEAPSQRAGKNSGTGGFALTVESAIPLQYDPSTPVGRANLGISESAEAILGAAGLIPFRLSDGDDTSCLNLYRPTQPRILGAPAAMIERGGFVFTQSLARTEEERRNPWTLLRRKFDDGAIPTIADEGAVLWQIHSKLGGDLSITDEAGRAVKLRIVGMLQWSILQGELVIADDRFKELFPAVSGPAYFLIDAPAENVSAVEQTLERELAAYSISAVSARQRLNEMFVVQNTYLSTFQTLGGLGLLLGTVGLAAVMLRNIWERRSELALMQILGFSRPALIWLVLSENMALVGVGLLAGLVSAGVVVAPHVAVRDGLIPWPSLLLTFTVVMGLALLVGLAVLVPALRTRLLPALRAE